MHAHRHHYGVKVNTTSVRAVAIVGEHNPRMGRPTKSSSERPEWAKRLEVARKLTRLEPKDFAAQLGFRGDRRAERYMKYERGEREPDIKTWEKIADVTGASLDFIIANRPAVNRDVLLSA